MGPLRRWLGLFTALKLPPAICFAGGGAHHRPLLAARLLAGAGRAVCRCRLRNSGCGEPASAASLPALRPVMVVSQPVLPACPQCGQNPPSVIGGLSADAEAPLVVALKPRGGGYCFWRNATARSTDCWFGPPRMQAILPSCHLEQTSRTSLCRTAALLLYQNRQTEQHAVLHPSTEPLLLSHHPPPLNHCFSRTIPLPPQLQCYLYQTSQNRMRQRTYRVGSHVRYGFTFTQCVRPPVEAR